MTTTLEATIDEVTTAPAGMELVLMPVVTVEDETARIAVLKQLWAYASGMELDAESALGTARVIKARVIYRAGMIGSKTGVPTNKGAARVLDMAHTSTTNYFKAGQALDKAGMIDYILSPTQAEKDLVAPFFGRTAAQKKREAAKGTNVRTPAGTDTDTDTDTDAGTKAPAPKDADSIILKDVLDAVEHLQDVVTKFTREQGFPGVVSENLQEVLFELAARIDSHAVDGGNA